MVKSITFKTAALCLLASAAFAQFYDIPNVSTNDISSNMIRTDWNSGTINVSGTVIGRPPPVANSMLYKDVVGAFRTTSSTVSNPGTPSETQSFISVNVLNNLNTSGTVNVSALNLISPTTLPACNASSNGRIVMSGTKFCVCDGTKYNNLLGGVNILTGILTGTCP